MMFIGMGLMLLLLLALVSVPILVAVFVLWQGRRANRQGELGQSQTKTRDA